MATLRPPGLLLALLGLICATGLFAQTPAEVQDLRFDDPASIIWNAVTGADVYNVYRGAVDGLDGSAPPRCHGLWLDAPAFGAPDAPGPGTGWAYLVTAESIAGGEGTPGSDSSAAGRPLLGHCGPVMRSHVLGRLGFGADDWTLDRMATLGLDGYVAEQLAPQTISESGNTALENGLAAYNPPANIIDLVARQVIQATYTRRQLDQQVATFWANHFNTYWAKVEQIYRVVYPPCGDQPQCDPNFPQKAAFEASAAQLRELEAFRQLGFDGSFREILEVSVRSPAMLLYLDSFANVVGTPNENHGRELLELHAMGVDGGYTQQDVEQTARVLTGWTICRKKLNQLDDPLAACIAQYWDETISGQWVSTFNPAQHDCGQKILFQGTPQETIIPDTCGNPAAGVNDLDLALDAIVAHPATPRFISEKILERFVTDQPDPALIDDLVAVWDDNGNPHGVGDLGAVLAATLTHPAFLDPNGVRDKIRTPLEQFVATLRSIRGTTDGATVVLASLVNAQHIPHYNEVPTGWPEDGGAWLDTTNTLERQNFALYTSALANPEFGSDPIGLLQDSGVSTAPGNAAAIVDFFVDRLFGGALTPAERQAAIDFLETDINGVPSPYDATRIRRTVGSMLGYPQFQEQ